MTDRTRVDRGIYKVGPCACHLRPKKHQVFDVVISLGYDRDKGGYPPLWRRHHGTLTTAQTFRRHLLTERDQGQLHPSSKHTLDALFDAWLADLSLLNNAPQTVNGYRRDAARYWRPALGNRSLDRIARADVRAVTDRLIKAGTGVHHAVSTISAAYSWAVKENWIGAHQDPTKKIPRPSRPNRLPQVPTPAQVRAVIAEARRCGLEPMARFLFLAAVTGCRSSELRGLRIRDVDLTRGVIGLVTAMSAEVEWTLKNRQERPVGLDETTIAVVEAQIAHMHEEAKKEGMVLRPDAFLFADDPYGSEHWREVTVSRVVSTLFDHTGRDEGEPCEHRDGEPCPRPGPLAHFTFKHLRKFVATYAHELGFTTNEVSARLGHDPAVDRRHYVGAVADKDHSLSTGMAELLVDSPAPTTPPE